MKPLFETIQDTDRVWVYQANRLFTNEEAEFITLSGKRFTDSWAAHGKSLRAQVQVVHNLFVVVNVDEMQAKATGCSIDSSVHWVSSLGKELGIDFFDRMRVAYLDKDSRIEIADAAEFEHLAHSGMIESDVYVFNNMAFIGKDLRNSWLIPANESWHSRYFEVVK
jgi:hypothetical protein